MDALADPKFPVLNIILCPPRAVKIQPTDGNKVALLG